LKQRLYSIVPSVTLPSLLDVSALTNYPTAAAAAAMLEKAAATSAASFEPFKTFRDLLNKDPSRSISTSEATEAANPQSASETSGLIQMNHPSRLGPAAAQKSRQPQAKTAEEALIQAIVAAQVCVQ
jgi:hypothetical protein